MKLLEDCEALVSAADVEDWPPGFLNACANAGLLERSDDARFIRCPNCDDPHDVEVLNLRAGERLKSIATCERTGVLSVPSTLLLQWRPSLRGLALFVARGLGLADEPTAMASGNAWNIGHLMRGGRALRVVLVRGESDLPTRFFAPTRLAALHLDDGAFTNVSASVTPIRVIDLLHWDPNAGVHFNADLLHAILSSSGDDASSTVAASGFQPPDHLVLDGREYRCPHLKPQLQRLLIHLAREDTVPIQSVVHDGEGAAWRRRWSPSDDRLVNSIRTSLNELKNVLAQAKPPLSVHFKFNKKSEHIERRLKG